mmetsp:Transcript_57066/g.133895  ORF Transcript_57066/g.133895 Transcript_57066/m.133895 type:complete len:215 (+) Transcript_57066:570-1214(+)
MWWMDGQRMTMSCALRCWWAMRCWQRSLMMQAMSRVHRQQMLTLMCVQSRWLRALWGLWWWWWCHRIQELRWRWMMGEVLCSRKRSVHGWPRRKCPLRVRWMRWEWMRVGEKPMLWRHACQWQPMMMWPRPRWCAQMWMMMAMCFQVRMRPWALRQWRMTAMTWRMVRCLAWLWRRMRSCGVQCRWMRMSYALLRCLWVKRMPAPWWMMTMTMR